MDYIFLFELTTKLFFYTNFWFIFYNNLKKNLDYNTKILQNIVGFVFSVISILYNDDYLVISYYLYDISNIIENNSKMKSLYLIHHIFSLHIMLLSVRDIYRHEIWTILLILEKSNIFMFINNICKELHIDNNYKNFTFVLHFFTYLWYRVCSLTLYLYTIRHLFDTMENTLLIAGFTIYLIGIGWTHKLYKKYMLMLELPECNFCEGYGRIKSNYIECDCKYGCIKCENLDKTGYVDCNQCLTTGLKIK